MNKINLAKCVATLLVVAIIYALIVGNKPVATHVGIIVGAMAMIPAILKWPLVK